MRRAHADRDDHGLPQEHQHQPDRTVLAPGPPHAEKRKPKRLDLANRLALRPAEAAEALGISESALRRLAPELPRVRMGGLIVYPVAALAKWLEARAVEDETDTDKAVREVLESLE